METCNHMSLKPCPFCGSGETQIRESNYWTGTRSTVLSVTVIHWCPKTDGQPFQTTIQTKGKTEEDAINAWNTRHA